MKDYYAILEINESASKETIEKVHKLLVKRYHPDLQDASKKAEYEEKMKEVNEAYEILTDPIQKKEYDAQLKEYKIQQIMEEIRAKQMMENVYRKYDDQYANNQTSQDYPQHYEDTVQNPFTMSDEEIRRQAQVYYEELYRQYLYYNGYVKEDFKTVAKRYITVILTIGILIGIAYAIYKIPYFNDILQKVVKSNDILNIIFGRFF